MSTVLIDWYRVECLRCLFAKNYRIGGGMGWIHAAEEGRRIHAKARPACVQRTSKKLKIVPVKVSAHR